MCWHGLRHGDDGIQEDPHLPLRKPGLHPVLGPSADGFVLHGERHAQQQGSLPLPHRPDNGGGCARWTPHGGDHGIGVQHEPHIIYDITSQVILPDRVQLAEAPLSDGRDFNAAGQDSVSEFPHEVTKRNGPLLLGLFQGGAGVFEVDSVHFLPG